MSTPRFARGSKSRLFLYIGAITVAGVVVYFFHHAQVELYDYQRKSEKCLQLQESLSAQFQVIIEYKVRLEKSLQQEKAEYRRLKEELQGKLDEEKQQREKENLENLNKYTSLQQQYKILQSHHEDLNDECARLRVTQLEGLDAKTKLEAALEAAKQEVQSIQKAKDKEMANLKSQYLHLEVENEKLQKQNKELTENGKDRNSNMNHMEKENIQLMNGIHALQSALSRCEAQSSSPLQMVGPSAMVGVGSAPKSSSVPRMSSSPVAVAADLRADVLPEPQHDNSPHDKVSRASPKSTTPQINPDAVLSREKAANALPLAVVAPDTVSKDHTPGAVGRSSRKEVDTNNGAAPAAGVGAAPPRARDFPGQVEAEGDGGHGGEEGAGGEPLGAGDGEVGAGAGAGAGGGGAAGGGDAGEVAEGEGALQAPHWEPREIPNQGPFHPPPAPGLLRPVVVGHGASHGAGAGAAVHPPQVGPQPPAMHAPLMPEGVVPAPRGYGLDRDAEVQPGHIANGDSGAMAMGDPWHWRRSKGWAAQPVGRARDAPRRRQLAEPQHVAPGIHGNMLVDEGIDEAEEREKEIPRQVHNPYGEYNGDNGEYEKDHRGDLQLEEGEEEEDDDMDQIDYANENGNGHDTRQKQVHAVKNAFPSVNKHDSVMINPK